jgi:uncharacterized cupredoxin-like copper-binding protein
MKQTRFINVFLVAMVLLIASGTVLAVASNGPTVGEVQETETTTVQENETVEQDETTAENETTVEAQRQADITFENQTSNGSTLVVERVTLAEDGFVAVHGVFGHVIGQSEYLETGTHENVTIEVGGNIPAAAIPGNVTDLEAVDENVTSTNETQNVSVSLSEEFVAVVHSDTNTNQEFDYVMTQGANDSAYQDDEGQFVWDNATVEFDEIELTIVGEGESEEEEEKEEEPPQTTEETTVPEESDTNETTADEQIETETTVEETEPVGEAAANATFSNQTSNGSAVVIDSVNIPGGGFIALVQADENETLEGLVRDPENRSTVGVSEYLEAGEHQNVTVQFNESAVGERDEMEMVAALHQDTNDNEEYDFNSSDGGEDTLYTLQGEPLTDSATVTFTTDEDAEVTTEMETETATENETNEAATETNNSEVAQTFIFDGETSGWIAQSPSDIEGEENPTLELEAGKTYNFTWVNTDGRPHNVVITDGDGNNIVRTEVISGEGGTQSVEFTAPESGGTYYCEVHPGSMRGQIEIVEGE